MEHIVATKRDIVSGVGVIVGVINGYHIENTLLFILSAVFTIYFLFRLAKV